MNYYDIYVLTIRARFKIHPQFLLLYNLNEEFNFKYIVLCDTFSKRQISR